MDRHFLALDLCAESGRVTLAKLNENRIDLTEVHRFTNTPVELLTGHYWDTLRLFEEVCAGIRAAGAVCHVIDGLGVTAWPYDFALLDAAGELLQNPRHPRDLANHGATEQAYRGVSREEIFRQTGIPATNGGALHQLYVLYHRSPALLGQASKLLFIPDLFNYFLTGTLTSERSIASTSQLYDPVRRCFATDMLRSLGITGGFFAELVNPGVELGPILPFIADRCGLKTEPFVYATGSHETASAVAAIPADSRENWCYISSGAKASMGIELAQPLINDAIREANFANEIGVAGMVRLSKSIPGFWILDDCIRAWAAEGRDYSYPGLIASAEEAPVTDTILDLDEFGSTGNLPHRVAEQCRNSGQQVPGDAGSMTRVILQSLAARYAEVLEELETLTAKSIDVIHIVGAGSQIDLLNQLVADVTGRRVMAGPAEATTLGNALTQALGAGDIGSLEELRGVVRYSCELEEFTPST